MSFQSEITVIPFGPGATNATGILAPIIRASGHILYLYGALAEPGYVLTDEEAVIELTHAADHLNQTRNVAEAAPISYIAKTYIAAFCSATKFALAEWSEWNTDDRGSHLRDLANRAAAIGAYLDNELAGVGLSDPGSSL